MQARKLGLKSSPGPTILLDMSDLGNGSCWVEIRDAKHADQCSSIEHLRNEIMQHSRTPVPTIPGSNST